MVSTEPTTPPAGPDKIESFPLKFKADVTNGLENVLVSYKRMFNGDNVGKTLVKL